MSCTRCCRDEYMETLELDQRLLVEAFIKVGIDKKPLVHEHTTCQENEPRINGGYWPDSGSCLRCFLLLEKG